MATWLHLLGPDDRNARAVVKSKGVSIDDVLLDIEHGQVPLGPHPRGITEAESRACVGYAREHMPARWRNANEDKGPRLAVGKTALRDAFHYHVEASNIKDHKNTVSSSMLLVAVYAVECGLKCLLLEKWGMNATSELEREYLTHDLNLLSITYAGKKLFPEQLKLKKKANTSENASLEMLHQVLRYGRRLHQDSYNSVVEATRNAVSYIEANLP